MFFLEFHSVGDKTETEGWDNRRAATHEGVEDGLAFGGYGGEDG